MQCDNNITYSDGCVENVDSDLVSQNKYIITINSGNSTSSF